MSAPSPLRRRPVDPEDIETLEDLVLGAVNDANNKAKDLATSHLGAITGGLGLPETLVTTFRFVTASNTSPDASCHTVYHPCRGWGMNSQPDQSGGQAESVIAPD